MTILHEIYDYVAAAKAPIPKQSFLRDFGYHNWCHAKRAGVIAEYQGRFVVLAAGATRPAERLKSSDQFDQQLKALLGSGPMTYSDIERQLESNYSRLIRSARRLQIVIEKEGRVTTWSIARPVATLRRRRHA